LKKGQGINHTPARTRKNYWTLKENNRLTLRAQLNISKSGQTLRKGAPFSKATTRIV
jgi:hypothetical protein